MPYQRDKRPGYVILAFLGLLFLALAPFLTLILWSTGI